MSLDENRSIARRFVLEHNQAGYASAFDALLAPDCLVHEYLPGVPPAMDRAVYEQFIAGFRGALPDIHNEIQEIIAEEGRVAVRWSGYGTHTGAALMGIEARGSALEANGVYIFRIANGKIAEVWNFWDTMNVLQQLGQTPG